MNMLSYASLIPLLCLLELSFLDSEVVQAITLSTSTPPWAYDYTNLGPATSNACRRAYAADIDCPPVLLRLVGGQQSEGWRPEFGELEGLCGRANEQSSSDKGQNQRVKRHIGGNVGGEGVGTGGVAKQVSHKPNNGNWSDPLLPPSRCLASLTAYVRRVGEFCGKRKDFVWETLQRPKVKRDDGGISGQDDSDSNGAGDDDGDDGKSGKNRTPDHVWTVGNMLRYSYAQACSRDERNDYCIISSTAKFANITTASLLLPKLVPASPTCDSLCSLKFHTLAKAFGGTSRRYFTPSGDLQRRPGNVARALTDGWEQAKSCKQVQGPVRTAAEEQQWGMQVKMPEAGITGGGKSKDGKGAGGGGGGGGGKGKNGGGVGGGGGNRGAADEDGDGVGTAAQSVTAETSVSASATAATTTAATATASATTAASGTSQASLSGHNLLEVWKMAVGLFLVGFVMSLL